MISEIYTRSMILNYDTADIHFDLDSELQSALNRLDDLSIRTKFKQATDPVNLAFRHIESKSLGYLAKDFIKLSAEEVIACISGFFK